MGVSLNVAFSKKVAPYGTLSEDHPALSAGLDRLDKILEKAGLPTLGQFVSMDPAEWEEMDPEDPKATALPPLRWFAPSDGLIVVEAAITRLRARPKALSWSTPALAELEQLRAELTAAEKRKAQFRLEFLD